MPKRAQHNETDIILNKDKLSYLIGKKSYIDFYAEWVREYGIDMEYTSFINLLNNRTSWKLVYAWTLCEMLGLRIEDLFYKIRHR